MRQLKSPWKKFAPLRFFSSPLSPTTPLPRPRDPETPRPLSPSSSNQSPPNLPLSNHIPLIRNTLIAIHHQYTPNPTLKPTPFHSSIHPLCNASIKVTLENFRPTPFFSLPLHSSAQCINQNPVMFPPTLFFFFPSPLSPSSIQPLHNASIKTQ